MAFFRQRNRRRMALSVGAVCGLALIGTGQASEPTFNPGSASVGETKLSSAGNVQLADNSAQSGQSSALQSGLSRVDSADIESDEAFRSLGVHTLKAGASTLAIRKQAVADLPLGQLSENGRLTAESLLKNVGLFRRLPTLSFEVDPDVYSYFVRNPDVAVATWRAMDISKFQLKELEAHSYYADAGDGSVGRVEVLRHLPEDMLIHCDGAFKSPLLPKPIVARSLMRLQTTFAKEADGRIIGTHYGDVFVEFPSQAVETVAKVISPVSHTIADRNFKQMTLFVHLMSQAMARHPGWIEAIGNKLDGVTPQRKLEFLEVSARSHAAVRKRLAGTSQLVPAISPDDVISPFRNVNQKSVSISSPTVQIGSIKLQD